MASSNFMGLDGFVWFTGVVEDRNDPAKLGRVRVRCLGFHTEDKNKITDNFSIGNSERIIDVNCIDLEETYRLKHNFREGLEFVIRNEEFSKWGLDYK